MIKSSRRRSREFALQGLYQWQLAGTEPETIMEQLADAEGYGKTDVVYLRDLLTGATAGAVEMDVKCR